MAQSDSALSRASRAAADASGAVVGIPEENLGEIPKAFIVKREGHTLSGEEVMAFVAERVAPYKKIRDVAFIREIPKNQSGKILRRILKVG